MKIRTPNKFRELTVRKLLGLVYRLENIGNGHPTVSGESAFISQFSERYADSIVCFDIGANVGDYTDLLLRSRGVKAARDAYHLFEPQKTCFADLKKRFAGERGIVLNNFALSDAKGEAVIYKDSDKSGLTSLYKRNLEYYGLKMDVEETIALETAADYIARNRISKIHLVKMDVEGNEMKTLKGFDSYLRPDFIDFIQFEYGGANLDSHTNLMDFFAFFEERGFIVCKMMRKGLERRTYDPRIENFICQNYVAVSKNIFETLV